MGHGQHHLLARPSGLHGGQDVLVELMCQGKVKRRDVVNRGHTRVERLAQGGHGLCHLCAPNANAVELRRAVLADGPDKPFFLGEIPRHQHLIVFEQLTRFVQRRGLGVDQLGVVGEFLFDF